MGVVTLIYERFRSHFTMRMMRQANGEGCDIFFSLFLRFPLAFIHFHHRDEEADGGGGCGEVKEKGYIERERKG